MSLNIPVKSMNEHYFMYVNTFTEETNPRLFTPLTHIETYSIYIYIFIYIIKVDYFISMFLPFSECFFFFLAAPVVVELSALGTDLHLKENRQKHHTDRYDNECLIVRRGAYFKLSLDLNRKYNKDQGDKIQLQLAVGKLLSAMKLLIHFQTSIVTPLKFGNG